MGCDIHLHAEVKVDGKWEHYAAPDVARNYELFGLMSDLFNNKVIASDKTPRGFPTDASKLTKMLYEMGDDYYYGASWLEGKEVSDLAKAYTEMYRKDKELCFSSLFIDVLHTYFVGIETENVRLVFWFDN